ncbi:MAG: hypothetical protein DMG65_05575 [Candidatus Angelobacter sp. Gp1-AA117]|nr:MAG: hypothetical protein DMG65_05575 [Candidatus Angelobacter sp. Gp1-AA117]
MATVSLPRPGKTAQAHRPAYFQYEDSISQFLLCGILIVSTLITVWLSWRWPIVVDAPLMQYAGFLMDHGKVLYRDIIDMNGIGAPFSSRLELHLLGYSDLGWRIYDLLFIALGGIGIFFICKPFGRVAVIFSTCLFAMTHIRLGMREVGQRDFQMAVLELLSAGFLLQGFRTRKPAWFIASGAAAMFGASIKPPGVLYVALFLVYTLAVIVSERNRKWMWPMSFVAGAAVPCVLAASYLIFNGAWHPFVEIYSEFLPLYSQLGHQSLPHLFSIVKAYIQPLLLLIIASGLLLTQKREGWLNQESGLVWLGSLCGLGCFLAQAKGWTYQLDPFMAFAGVWCGIAVATLMRDRRAMIRLALSLVLALWVVVWIPTFIRHTSTGRYDRKNAHLLESEISKLRAEGRNNGIQVMDTSQGAVLALYDLKLVQSTGFLYDFYFYQFPDQPYVRQLRLRFLKELDAARPDLLVISNQSWPDPRLGYTRLDQWPDFRNSLAENYKLEVETLGYKIYVRR